MTGNQRNLTVSTGLSLTRFNLSPTPLLKGLEVAIRNKIEQEVTQKASSSLHKPLSVIKTPEAKGNPGAARPGTSSK